MRDGSLAEDEDMSLHDNGKLDRVMDFSKSFPYWKHLKPKANPGDVFWVRETWQHSDDLDNPYWYRQKYEDEHIKEYYEGMKWKPSIFMPKEACRIFLKVTNVRI